MLPLVFLMGFGPLLRWKEASLAESARRLWPHLAAAVAIGLVVLIATIGMPTVMVGVGVVLALWVTLGTLEHLRQRIANKNNLWTGLSSVPLAFWGMTVAHLGVAVFIVGVTLVTAYGVEKDIRLAPGETYELGGYTFRFMGTRQVRGPNYLADQGLIVAKPASGGKPIELAPQKRIYRVQQNPMTEAAIDPGITRDLYVALGEPVADGAWSVRLYYKPYVRWIWLGALIMGLGGLLAASDRRYRLAARKQSTALVQNSAARANV